MYSRNDDFTYDSQGRIEPTYENLLHIFCTDPELGHIRFDTRAGRAIDVSLSESPTSMVFRQSEHEFVHNLPALEKYVASVYNIDGLTVSLVAGAYDEYLKFFAYDPVQEYLRSLKWDGFSRLGLVLPGSTGTREDYELAKRIFVGSVKRVLYPGSQQDFVPVFLGDTGGDIGMWLNLIGAGYTGFFPSPNLNSLALPEQTWLAVHDVSDKNSQPALRDFYNKSTRAWYVSNNGEGLQHRNWVTWGITSNQYLKENNPLPGKLLFIEAPEVFDPEKYFENSHGISNEFRNQVWSEAVHLAK
nr:MAG TPA: putative P-loop ATPase [Caudoviricetes sp.]